ncbi:hypothetical protein KP509_23G057800 [Ceratopteris richardii]|uniref:Xyloglucan endotransglucosylase/hydrolase n=1 Tax=Ceratopteris richardii TaxID=49495 RepID=A0A8T2S2C3_CERRI|nr:hypothetical protein KP509_23G057800 [Ceratopteris richardii]
MSLRVHAFLTTLFLTLLGAARSEDLSSLFYTTSTADHVQFADDGQEINLALDQKNASGFQSYDAYLFGLFNMRIKLVSGDSAGTVTTYYFTSFGERHDELDFEFLGNVSGEPIILQTNVFSNGIGGREQRIFLWFDPTIDFHNYTLLWNPWQIVFLVDGVPIRVFPNIEKEEGVPYLHNQSMKVFATIWDGDSWATEGGRVKINWENAPFVASYRDFSADSCSETSTMSANDCATTKWWSQLAYQALDVGQLDKLKWIQSNMTVYNYCTDVGRYNVTPPECRYNAPISTGLVAPSSSPSTPTSLPLVASPSSTPGASSLGPSGPPSSTAYLARHVSQLTPFFLILSLIFMVIE